MPRKSSNQKVVKQAAFLMAAHIISSIIGLLYRSPLQTIMGDVGAGYYSFAYEWYMIILLISSYSIPSAVSKVMAERLAVKEYKNASRVFRAALIYVLGIGGIGACFAYFAAPWLLRDTPDAVLALRILAPTIWLSGFLGVLRGFFQAHNTMRPTAVSQVIEQIVNAVFSVLMAWLFIKIHTGAGQPGKYGAAGGTFGTFSGVLAGLLFMLLVYFYNRKTIRKRIDADRHRNTEPYQDVFRDILLMVTPIILATCVYNVTTIIDQRMFTRLMIGHGAAAETVSETAEAAAETAGEAVSAAAETVSETAEAAAEAAETAAEAAGEAGEAAEAAGEAAGALTYDADSIHSDMVKSMREIVAGVIRTPEVSEDAAAADAVIEESRAQLAARSEGESGIRIPQQQGRVQAGKLSIDDILLSMGDRGTEVREAAAKATGAGRAQEEGQETGTAPAGVVSAIDEALMGMGVERRTPLSADEKKKPAAGTGSGEDDLLPGEEIAQRAEAEAAAKKKAAEEAAAAAAALQDDEEAAAAAASVKAAFAGEGEEAAGEQAPQEEEEEREAILTAKTRVLPTEEIAARYARRPLRLEEEEETAAAEETAAGETAAQETAQAAEEAAEEAFEEEGAGEAAYGETAEETLTEEGEGEEEAGEAEEAPEETAGQTGSGLRVRDSQRGLFRGFLEIGSLDEQIAAAIMNAGNKGQDRTSRTGNILIFGDHGCGKTTIATGIAKAIAMDRGAQYLKMARIYAADLNRKDIPATIAKIAGGILIIEEAGDLDDAIVDQLTTAMEFRTDGMIMILEDERRYIHDKLMRHPRFTMKFTSQIYIPAFTIDELVRFGEIYALSKDYSLSDGAAAALYERIGSVSMQGDAVSITNVIELVDRAIGKASGFMRKLAGKKRYDENDCVILLEKDFRK